MKNIIANFYTKFINILIPPICGLCSNFTLDHKSICHECANSFEYMTSDQCNICGYPFEVNVGKDIICANCIAEMPYFDRAYSVYIYGGAARSLILRLKHMDGTHLAPVAAMRLWNLIKNTDISADMVIPIPLHIKKHFKRRYNQAGLIAKHISKLSDIPFEPNILLRKKDGTQKDKTHAQRKTEIKGSFKISNKDKLKEKVVVLIDDVITTGSTVNEAAKVLKKHGADRVYVFTLARVSFNKHKTDF